MGVLKVTGSGASDFLQYVTTNNIQKADQKMIYSMILNESGGILDDITVGKLDDFFLVVVNASNKSKILDWFSKHQQDHVQVEDLSDRRGFIALQGPSAITILEAYLEKSMSKYPRFSLFRETILDEDVFVMRTGYTGEDGVELSIPHAILPQVWADLLSKGVVPCGLGCRDSLRIEAGLPLYGQELSEKVHPFMTQYPWVVKWDKQFIGKDALLVLKDKPRYKTVGVTLLERAIPRFDYPILEGGYITSGTLSPSLDKPIGIAFVPPEYAVPGKKVRVQIRKKVVEGLVVSLPFV
jgi:aminomethyltransferase